MDTFDKYLGALPSVLTLPTGEVRGGECGLGETRSHKEVGGVGCVCGRRRRRGKMRSKVVGIWDLFILLFTLLFIHAEGV